MTGWWSWSWMPAIVGRSTVNFMASGSELIRGLDHEALAGDRLGDSFKTSLGIQVQTEALSFGSKAQNAVEVVRAVIAMALV